MVVMCWPAIYSFTDCLAKVDKRETQRDTKLYGGNVVAVYIKLHTMSDEVLIGEKVKHASEQW